MTRFVKWLTAHGSRLTANCAHNNELKILVCYNKPFAIPQNNDILLPVQSGKKVSQYDLNMQSDCDVNGQPCDSISDKNSSYCELGVLYWAWKNVKKIYPDLKYIGLFHYRRFLAFNKHESKNFVMPRPENDISSYTITPENLNEIINYIENGYIIVRKPEHFGFSAIDQHEGLFTKDFAKLTTGLVMNIIKYNCPDYYQDFINCMEKNNIFHPNHIFIMKFEDFENMCEWLFGVLGMLDKVIPAIDKEISSHCDETYQKRFAGYIGERLYNIWLRHSGKKLKCYPYYFYDQNNKPGSFLTDRFIACKKFFERVRDDLKFKIRYSRKKPKF